MLLIQVWFTLALAIILLFSRKAQYYRNSPRVIEMRHFKHFDKGKFLSDLNQLSWANNVDLYSDPNDMWREWKEMFLGCVDKHAPLKLKSELLCKIRKWDFLKGNLGCWRELTLSCSKWCLNYKFY